jgi:hypothetical protein
MQLLSVDLDAYNRESIQTSHLGTTTAHTFIPGSLYDPGELSFETQFEPGGLAYGGLMVAAAQVATIVWGGVTNTSWAFSCFTTNMSISAALEELITATITAKATGALTLDTTP